MRLTEYETKIGFTIHALRKLRGFKQFVLADALKLDQSSISRIEKGETSISCGQLYVIAKTIRATTFQILAIAETEISDVNENKIPAVSELIWKIILSHEHTHTNYVFSVQEIEYVIHSLHADYITKKRQ